jgi:hypothetical protein
MLPENKDRKSQNYIVEENGSPGREIFGYHWHPNERTAITFPHFHLTKALGPCKMRCAKHISRRDV